ncbi:hypothetical protein BDV18DRAFT_147812 [Aspergillus unguis]
MTNTDTFSGGGFMPASLPSPAPTTSTSASTATPSLLPKQRSHPLKAGSMKEASVIGYVDKAILKINRRHAKKFSSVFEQGQSQTRTATGTVTGNALSVQGDQKKDQDAEGERGYESFSEVVKDIEGVVDVLWVSGTPTLQTPYLISLSVLFNTYLPSYPFKPKPTFRLLRKLDSFFASLIMGEDSETGQPLSGFETRRNVVSMTEKVRIKSIAEAGRVGVVEVQGGDDEFEDDEEEEEEDEDGDDEDDMDVDGLGPTPGRWEMEMARVYEKTIQLLGDELGAEVEYCDEDMAKGDEGENSIAASP